MARTTFFLHAENWLHLMFEKSTAFTFYRTWFISLFYLSFSLFLSTRWEKNFVVFAHVCQQQSYFVMVFFSFFKFILFAVAILMGSISSYIIVVHMTSSVRQNLSLEKWERTRIQCLKNVHLLFRSFFRCWI